MVREPVESKTILDDCEAQRLVPRGNLCEVVAKLNSSFLEVTSARWLWSSVTDSHR